MGSDLNITNELQEYILNHGHSLHPIQKEIINYNNSLGEIKRMQISISQCQFLDLIIKISNIKKILEIGTFTGLSTLSMSLALPDDGKIISLDKNEQTNKIAINFFKKAKQDQKIITLIKPALESLAEIKEKFELIFIDADKGNYKQYYEKSLSLLETRGLIIIDNVLWYGEVAVENNQDKITKTIKDFNEFVSNDNRVEKIIIPLGDGMTICRKL
ncbi:class I SAM-dependent methyltransferase [Candidatus Pelagibacter sp.]|nr:class I SAM-dependent methyltransferase [Candidatus Pelagibacter sp.]